MEVVINVEDVSKRFRLYYDRPLTLKERVIRGSKGGYKEFYAIKNVSFTIKKGSTVGLIGQNGSGKSTMLKMINRTMFPDEGKITIKGKVASLIELGAGFHPELSGRENIYNNASIFGFTREEIEEKIPDIIKFSELEDFIDNPIRTYSSGMYARLAFSVAIHVEADILLVDEILGVGDLNFQAKCADKIYEMRKNGTTILVVTHDLSTIDRLCDYAVWLDHGKKIAEGEPKEIQNRYLEFMASQQQERKEVESGEVQNCKDEIINIDKGVIEFEESLKKQVITHLGEHFGTGDILFTKVKLLNEKGIDKRSFHTGEKMTLYVEYLCQEPIENLKPNFGFEISTSQGQYLYGTNTTREGIRDISLKHSGDIKIEFDQLNLLPGDYLIGIAVANATETVSYDHYHNIAQFKIYSSSREVGIFRIEHSFFIDDKNIKNEVSL